MSAFRSIWGRDAVEQAVGGAHSVFVPVLVASQKAPGPHVAEPMPGWRLCVVAVGAPRWEIDFGFLMWRWFCEAMLRWFCVFWLGFPVSLAASFCLGSLGGLGLPLPTVGGSLTVMVRSRYGLYGWYFPDVLRDRQELFVYTGSFGCFAVRIPLRFFLLASLCRLGKARIKFKELITV